MSVRRIYRIPTRRRGGSALETVRTVAAIVSAIASLSTLFLLLLRII